MPKKTGLEIEIRSFKPSRLRKIILVDVNDEMVTAWRKALSS